MIMNLKYMNIQNTKLNYCLKSLAQINMMHRKLNNKNNGKTTKKDMD